jgi:hypothetical protein
MSNIPQAIIEYVEEGFHCLAKALEGIHNANAEIESRGEIDEEGVLEDAFGRIMETIADLTDLINENGGASYANNETEFSYSLKKSLKYLDAAGEHFHDDDNIGYGALDAQRLRDITNDLRKYVDCVKETN